VPAGADRSTTGGSTSGGAPSDCVEPMFREVCLSTCFGEEGSIFDRICVNCAWTCPEGATFSEDCPPENCAGTLTHCCDAMGRSSLRECGADGLRQSCPSGSRPIAFGGVCAPPGVLVESCLELDDAPCDVVGSTCNQGGTACECPEIPSTPRLWECLDLDSSCEAPVAAA
jgi:hypothetical protein